MLAAAPATFAQEPELVVVDVLQGVAAESSIESVAWGDVDSDGDPDLYLTANGANYLFRNNGSW